MEGLSVGVEVAVEPPHHMLPAGHSLLHALRALGAELAPKDDASRTAG